MDATVEVTVDQRVEEYIYVRSKLDDLKKDYEAKKEALQKVQDYLSGWLQEFLDKSGQESAKTKHGTCYLSTRYSAPLSDPEAFMNFVRSTEQFELLDKRANVTAVRAYAEEHDALPPGCNLNGVTTVGVRAPTAR